MKTFATHTLFFLTLVIGNLSADIVDQLQLESLASQVKVENGGLTITTKKSGMRYLMIIDSGPDRVTEYNETLYLPKGFSSALFAEHHTSYSINKDENNGGIYHLKHKVDLQTFGDSLTIRHIKFRIHESSIEIVSNETEIIPAPSLAQKGNADSNNLIPNSGIGIVEAEHSSKNAKMPVNSSNEDISQFKVIAFMALGLILIIWISFQASRKSTRRLK